jgi:predicted PurR-regulated permease PerM
VARGLLLIGIVFLLREAHALMLPVAVAVVLTLVLSTPVRFLRRHGIPEFIGAGLLVLSLIGGSMLLATTLVGPASEWWDRAPSSFAALVERGEQLRASIRFIAPPPARRAATAPPPADPLKEKIVSESVALTGLVIGRTFTFGLSVLATVILLYFLLASEHWLLSRTIEAIARRRTRALLLGGVRSAQREIGRFIGSLSIINLAVAIVTALMMMYIDLPNPVLWGSIAGFLNFIPYIGPILVVGLLLLAGAVSFAATPALIIAPAAAFLLVHAIESNLASPWFIGRRLALSRISIFLSVMFWGWLWGLAGAVLAVPFLIAIRCTCRRVRRLRRWCVYLDESRDPPPTLSFLLDKGAIRARGAIFRRAERRQSPQGISDSGSAE